MTPILRFDRGTLLLEGLAADQVPEGFVYDERVHLWRAPASAYRGAVAVLHRRGEPYEDRARAYVTLGRPHTLIRTPRPYQVDALAAWKAAGRRGLVVLPTGAGKSLVAELCIADADRSALVIAPTLDLVSQWYDVLRRAFGEPVGILGGGVHEVEALTVSTYDSAHLYAEKYGDRFGLVIYDEVHHLPGPSYLMAARSMLAPFRLGLTATLERPDGGHTELFDLVGQVVYERTIRELAGGFLAPYTTEVLEVHLDEDERLRYEAAVATFRAFRQSRGIQSGMSGFQRFIRESARDDEGRAAMAAYRESRRIVQRTPRKLELLSDLLGEHAGARILVFTADNATAYQISRTFLVPAITHKTDPKERRLYLDGFQDRTLPVLATSRVLNEGVDLPEAEIAVILSGTSTVREHVQRLGRILRPREGKQAILYELIVAGTVEQHASARRRDHEAYRDQGAD